MSARDLLRHAAATGWTVTPTRAGHLRLDHEAATMPVFCAGTPSDHRAVKNAVAMMRRALPPEDKEPKPERPRRKPKSPRKRQVEQPVEMYRPPEPLAPAGCGGSAPRRRPVPGGPRLAMTRWP